MSIIDDIIDIFNGGPRDWKQRLKDSISFISPEGNEFNAKWIGGPRSIDKKLGIFIYPKVKGNIVQDLDVNSTRYSLTIYFDGPDNDIISRAFFAAARERGQWKVDHPVHGFMGLQLISITENIEPVRSGNITEINTEWIEPIDPTTLQTARELAGINDALANDLDISAVDQFVATVNEASKTLQATIKNTVQGVQNVSDYILGPIAATVDAVNNTFLAIQNGIQDTLDATVLAPISLAGQIQQLIQLPLLANNDIVARNDAYLNFINDIISNLPSKADQESKNKTVVYELALSAALTAISKIATTGIEASKAGIPVATGVQSVTVATPVQTRAQAVELAIEISDTFKTVTDALDNVQSSFSNSPIEGQYFSQSQSFSRAALLMSNTMRYLLLSSYDLKIERRFILDRPRAPIEIAFTEYGGPGDNDSNFDLFIASNKLKGKDIILLPAGREVVVYV